ncbi:MAG: HD domain-containing protein [Deinococcus-Thermus bacterium]|nr:HD domain-containing protein [Deinococcota bacterium]
MSALAYLLHAYRLKDRPRTGWGLRGVADPESVADHSWGTALLCLVFADEAGVDTAEALEIALVHDIAEAETGDFARRDDADVAGKPALEADAMAGLAALWAGPAAERVQRRWEAYETRSGRAARFVRDMNLLDMCLQALAYARRGGGGAADGALDEFVASAEARVETDVGRARVAEVAAAYRASRRSEDGAAPGMPPIDGPPPASDGSD